MALAAPDRFGLGGRATVRGFDGEMGLSGDTGTLLRQELQWNLGGAWGQLYLALDAGEVGGPATAGLEDRFMAGTAWGWRLSGKHHSLDAFAGRPLHTPATVRTGETAAGFSFNLNF
ncbi:MAG: ShlB/FhaC/HecB family hemolysin secretion/activation protein [Rhodoferax sp.]|nr:MAG: ShlB/FhaC/HecB family hemolysin secretion/activation protein [Rhodoferax sp.]